MYVVADIERAFDSVNRVKLWQKLSMCNITGKILKVVRNLYADARSCVTNGNLMSKLFMCQNRVRQGETLSPLLFSIYLQNLKSFLSKYADGLKTLQSSGTEM